MSGLRLVGIFAHGMILQRGVPVRVFGFAGPGEGIRVQLGEDREETAAGNSGRWQVELPARETGGPLRLTVRGATEEISRDEIWMGDVWLCSGQSNMQRALRTADTATVDIPAADFPMIRLATVAGVPVSEPQDDVEVSWVACTPGTAAGFSAVAFYFGREIHQKVKVPVGLINCSVGGTPIEAWMSIESLRRCSGGSRSLVIRREAEREEAACPEDFEQKLATWEAAAQEALSQPAGRVGEAATTGLAGPWQRVTGPYFFGICWYEREFFFPEEWNGLEVLLRMEPVQFAAAIFLNGNPIGETRLHEVSEPDGSREYAISKNLVRPGISRVGIRLMVRKDMPCARPTAGRQWLECPELSEILPLEGGWSACVEREFGPKPQAKNQLKNRAGHLYNGFIHPVAPFSLRGMLWYQGEANVSRWEDYRELFPVLVRSWRACWGMPELPFYFVQLPNFNEPPGAERENRWAEMRETQKAALREPQTAMAVTLDIGDPGDIHPANKKDVGIRLALLALKRTYALELTRSNPGAIPVLDSGPVFRAARWEEGSLRLFFDSAEGGLCSARTPLPGFIARDPEGRSLAVSAVMDGETIRVFFHSQGTFGELYYAWSDNPEVSLRNAVGLPMAPFCLTCKMIAGEPLGSGRSLLVNS